MNHEHHQKVAQFYDEVYYRDTQPGGSPSNHLKRLAARLNVTAGQTLLDVACGTGNWLQVASDRGAAVSGIDISEKAIAVCQDRLPASELRVGPAETLPFSNDFFDIVTCLGSLEHFLDQPKALREMVRVAKPGAQVLILVPNAGFLTYRLGLYKGTHQQAVHETIRSLSEWRRMFEEAGLEVHDRWKDLHVLTRSWIFRAPWYLVPLRALQGAALAVWPLAWQYQVYHLCRKPKGA